MLLVLELVDSLSNLLIKLLFMIFYLVLKVRCKKFKTKLESIKVNKITLKFIIKLKMSLILHIRTDKRKISA